MKKLSIACFALLLLVGCEKEETKAVLSPEAVAPQITSQANGFTKTITEETTGEMLKFDWSGAEYGVSTEVTYVLELDSVGRSFTSPVTLGSTAGKSLGTTLGDLNTKLLEQLKVTPNVASALELRVRASVNTKFPTVSNVVKITVTPWKPIEADKPATLWLPGGYQGWNPANAPVILAVSETIFEGYVYIASGTAFKFTSAPDWDHINYGDSKTTGVLTTDGKADGLSLPESGYYKFRVDTDKLTYQIGRITTWGLIGTATPGEWTTSTAMTFDQVKGTWSKTVNLVKGALKFRANDGWAINYGPTNSSDLKGTLTATDDAITIPEDGNYTVTLDLSRSKSPYLYSYTVKKN
ncbi:SusE domain-containing protein [Chryseolinea lacunae]|uniref:SusE domain-containing protein n=1 Tax=Chryseolinea lacunae TaxID=2801331 RepID=A0ABS1KKR6_9BACT|nr:SusE domain-containing protein [Chryseolinea lacunae]MBL0740055.1 SusE domain-containing protein [Chryseolinea lacunae]